MISCDWVWKPAFDRTRSRSWDLLAEVSGSNYGPHKVRSLKYHDRYSLTKTLDAAFRLPCLNHACDAGVEVMADLFQEDHGRKHRIGLSVTLR